MTNPDLDSITTTGRVDAPETLDTPVTLDSLSVPALGTAFVNDLYITCSEQTSDACTYAYSGPRPIQNYNLSGLVVYPECEACDAPLEVLEGEYE